MGERVRYSAEQIKALTTLAGGDYLVFDFVGGIYTFTPGTLTIHEINNQTARSLVDRGLVAFAPGSRFRADITDAGRAVIRSKGVIGSC